MTIEYSVSATRPKAAPPHPATGTLACLSRPRIAGNRDLNGDPCLVEHPRARSTAESAKPVLPEERHQTALLVDDEPALRDLVETILTKLGYRVFTCGDGHEALRFADHHDSAINLLVTDLVMPRVGGMELAQKLLAARPGLSVLLMSGFSQDKRTLHELLTKRPDVEFLQKPFGLVDLERTLCALGHGDPSPPAAPG